MKLTKQTNRRETETSRRSTERPFKCSLRRPALSRLAITYSYFGRARELLEQARAMTEALGDTDGVGRACNVPTPRAPGNGNVTTYVTPPKGLKGFIPVGPRPTESVLDTPVHANKELFVNFAEKSRKGGTKAKMEIWVVNLGEANVRRR